jgi:hypothetical protein
VPPGPKAPEASGEPAEPGDAAAGDVTRYEQLRQQVLAGEAGGWRLGLGVLQHRGVAAWLAAWDRLPALPAPAAPLSAPPARPAPGSGEQLVAALAAMALSCLAARG